MTLERGGISQLFFDRPGLYFQNQSSGGSPPSVNEEFNHIQDHCNDLDNNPVEERLEITPPDVPSPPDTVPPPPPPPAPAIPDHNVWDWTDH